MSSKWYNSGWTEERKAKQREAIQRWKPWEKSTGPRTKHGKAASAANGVYAYLKRLTTEQWLRWAKRF